MHAMSRLNSISNRTAGSHGPSLPPHTGGGGDDDRNSRDGMPDSMPNYGERLRRARLALAATMEFARRDITRQSALDPVRYIPGVSLGEEPNTPWLALTTVLGATFLAG